MGDSQYITLTLLRTKFNTAPPFKEMSEMGQKRDNIYTRCAKQKLFVWNSVLIPTTEKHWLQTVNNPMFWLETVNCIGPKMRNAFDHGVCTVDNSTVGTEIDNKLECCRRGD